MQKRRRALTCDGKQKHETKQAAFDHLHALRRKGAALLVVYRCPYCQHFHVGHPGRYRGQR